MARWRGSTGRPARRRARRGEEPFEKRRPVTAYQCSRAPRPLSNTLSGYAFGGPGGGAGRRAALFKRSPSAHAPGWVLGIFVEGEEEPRFSKDLPPSRTGYSHLHADELGFNPDDVDLHYVLVSAEVLEM